MHRKSWIALAIAGTCVLAGLQWSGVSAQDGAGADEPSERSGHRCRNSTIRGTYGAQIQGTRPSGPGGPMESVIGVVIRTYDGKGTFTQIGDVKGSISGWVSDQESFGTYEVSLDCRAVAFFEPAPGLLVQERLVILDGGNEIRSATMTPPPVLVTGVHKRTRAR